MTPVCSYICALYCKSNGY